MPTFVLAVPPSANKLFANVPGKGRVKASAYRSWIRGELKALMAQRAKPFPARATVAITLPSGTRGDPDNRIKACMDLLVRAGILANDSSKQIAGISVYFGNVDMMHVEISEFAAAKGGAA